MDQAVYWTMVGAVAQIAGAVATFAAVAFALWQTLSERRVSLRVLANTSLIFDGVGNPPEAVMSFSITNTGQRPVTLQSVGWETGWSRIGPKWLQKQYAIQMTDRLGAPQPPQVLQPGQSVTLMADGCHVFGEGRYDGLFLRDMPLFGRRRTRIRAVAHTTLRSVKAKPSGDLVDDLLGGREEKDSVIAQRIASSKASSQA